MSVFFNSKLNDYKVGFGGYSEKKSIVTNRKLGQ